MDLSKNNLPNLVVPSNCNFLSEFLKMGCNGIGNYWPCVLNKIRGIVDFRIVEIINILL